MFRVKVFGAGGFRAVAGAMAFAVALAACSPKGLIDSAVPGAGGPVKGEVLGTGTIRIGLLLPLSATGNAGTIARDMRNAADLAVREFKTANIQVLIKDDLGTPDGASTATAAAISEGASLILGPLFAQSVTSAAAVAKPKNVPIIAFSTDSSTASRGVYLMSFLPQTDVDRVIRFSARQGKNSFAALLPANAYGAVVQGTLQTAAANAGGRVVALEQYALDRVSMQEKATAIAAIIKQGTVNAVFIPDGGDTTPFIVQVLSANGVQPQSIKYLGSGQWNDPRTIREPNLDGGWFPGPEMGPFNAFSERYKAAFGAEPVRNASLAYDAVSLAAGLSGRYGADAFSDKNLTVSSGFIGIDGAFRFLSNGLNERALAVYQIERGTAGVIDPAPKNFVKGAGL